MTNLTRRVVPFLASIVLLANAGGARGQFGRVADGGVGGFGGGFGGQSTESPGGLGGGGFGARQQTDSVHVAGQKLPTRNLPAVPADLVEPIGLAAVNRPVWEKLRSQRVTLNFVETPLSDFVDFLRENTGLNLMLNRVMLEDEGITADTPITTAVENARLDQALTRTLRQLNCTFIVRSGVVEITSLLGAGNELVVRVYPVADLVWSGDDAGAINADSLAELIRQTVAPNSWSTVGGPGDVHFFAANLSVAINQTEAIHHEIAALLRTLRESRAVDLPREPGGERRNPARPSGDSSERDDDSNTAGVTGAGLQDRRDNVRSRRSQRANQPAQPRVFGASEGEWRLRKVLRERRCTLEFVETPIADIVEFLRDYSKLAIDLDRASLEEEGVTSDTPLSIRLQDLPLGDAIDLLLRQLNLTWLVRDDALVITSQLAAGNELVARSYPAADLVVVRNGDERWSIGHDDLVQLIQQVVDPNSWSTVGGAGTIEYFAASQCIAVNQTQRTHDAVSALLTMLREAADRLPELSRATGVPFSERLGRQRLKWAREQAALNAAEQARSEKTAAALARQAEEDRTKPELAKLRAEIQLIRAQSAIAEAESKHHAETHQAQLDKMKAEAAAAKARTALAEAQRRALQPAPAQGSVATPTSDGVCPICKRPFKK